MGTFDALIELVRGPQKSTFTPAPPLTQYPTPEDAQFARQQGFGYGDPNESYIQGNSARVVGRRFPDSGQQPWRPTSAAGMWDDEAVALANDDSASRSLDLTDPANKPVADSLGDQLAQAALAANRMPVAALGFDPGRAAFDIRTPKPTIGGLYGEDTDSIYANTANPSSILHESVHRGLSQLRADPALGELFRNLPEELAVRYMMATQAGDPEKGSGPVADKQRASALDVFNSGLYGDTLKRLDRAAQEAIKNRRPGGPR